VLVRNVSIVPLYSLGRYMHKTHRTCWCQTGDAYLLMSYKNLLDFFLSCVFGNSISMQLVAANDTREESIVFPCYTLPYQGGDVSDLVSAITLYDNGDGHVRAVLRWSKIGGKEMPLDGW
jgi:hypothetical protein